MEYGKKCSFTGYRTSKLIESVREASIGIEDIRNALKQLILEKVEAGFFIFQCGMALGSDTIFAEEVINVREENPAVQIYAIIPCIHQELYWSDADKERYYDLLRVADKVIYTGEKYYAGCMQVRNRYLVDHCDELIAVYDGKKGGSAFTVKYAEKKRKKVTILDPSEFMKITLYN